MNSGFLTIHFDHSAKTDSGIELSLDREPITQFQEENNGKLFAAFWRNMDLNYSQRPCIWISFGPMPHQQGDRPPGEIRKIPRTASYQPRESTSVSFCDLYMSPSYSGLDSSESVHTMRPFIAHHVETAGE
jgi:hypothetical protein